MDYVDDRDTHIVVDACLDVCSITYYKICVSSQLDLGSDLSPWSCSTGMRIAWFSDASVHVLVHFR